MASWLDRIPVVRSILSRHRLAMCLIIDRTKTTRMAVVMVLSLGMHRKHALLQKYARADSTLKLLQPKISIHFNKPIPL